MDPFQQSKYCSRPRQWGKREESGFTGSKVEVEEIRHGGHTDIGDEGEGGIKYDLKGFSPV